MSFSIFPLSTTRHSGILNGIKVFHANIHLFIMMATASLCHQIKHKYKTVTKRQSVAFSHKSALGRGAAVRALGRIIPPQVAQCAQDRLYICSSQSMLVWRGSWQYGPT